MMSLIQQLRDALEPFSEARMAVLFGSQARKKATRHSDVDLGVLLAEGTSVAALWDIDAAAAEATRRTIDLVDLRRAPPLLRFEIARDGEVLLERESGLWVGFKARAMIDWWDFAPIARRAHRIAIRRLREEAALGSA